MKETILAMIAEKRQMATEKYIKRMDELFAEYSTKSSVKEKNEVIMAVAVLGRAYDELLRMYESIEEKLDSEIRHNISRYEGFFEAKINGEFHEWG